MSKIEMRNSKIAEPPSLGSDSVRDFTDLDAWKLARELRRSIYSITRKFPSEERHVLTSQLRCAVLSITANIAERFGRYSYRENIQYCRQARGSAFEVRDHLTSALDAGYIATEDANGLDAAAQRVIQVLNGYIRVTQKRDASRRQAN